MAPYQELCFLLREYDTAASAGDAKNAALTAARIFEAAGLLVYQAEAQVERGLNNRQLSITVQ